MNDSFRFVALRVPLVISLMALVPGVALPDATDTSNESTVAETDSGQQSVDNAVAAFLARVSTSVVDVESGSDSPHIAQLRNKPVLQYSLNDKERGSVWVWTHDKVPATIAHVKATKEGEVIQFALTKVTRNKLEGKIDDQTWKPKQEGSFSFQPLPQTEVLIGQQFGQVEAPLDDEARDTMARAIAKQFKAFIDAKNSIVNLDLQEEPIHSYKQNEALAGYLFAFSESEMKEPALIFVLQAREARWEFGVARCSSPKLVVHFGRHHVWSTPARSNGEDSTGDYWVALDKRTTKR